MRTFFGKTLFVLISLSLFSCLTEDEVSTGAGSTTLNVRLTDSPGDYEEVNVDIQGMRIKMAESEGENEWIELENFNRGIYNLLDFTGGADTLLASDEIPAGTISQIRLILGTENSVKTNNEFHDLKTPSAQQSGLKLKVNAQILKGIDYTLVLDFDAARSVVKAGNSGKYILKPTINAVTEATSGAIKGKIIPAEAHPAIWALVDSDTIAGTYADETGEFFIRGLSEQTYSVVFKPASGFKTNTVEGVEVDLGKIVDLGEIEIEEGEEEDQEEEDQENEEEEQNNEDDSESI